MHTLAFIFYILIFIFGLGTLAENDGGCKATGQKPYDYKQALCMSFLFYEAQRSGYLPTEQRIKWRGDSGLNDGSNVGQDLVGGYYESNNYVKNGFTLAFITTTLSWGLLSYPDGYERAGQTNYARTTIKIATDYILKAHTGTNEIYGQVGDSAIEQQSWARPEDMMPMPRPAFKITTEQPGSDLAGETAAALASSYLLFKDVDSSYANRLLLMAREMFDFADMFRGYFINYPWSLYGDDLAWAAVWMFKATNEQLYMDKALEYIDEFNLLKGEQLFDTDSKAPGVYALMIELNNDPFYRNRLDQYVQFMINDMPYTPKGLLYMSEWQPLKEAAGIAFIAARAASLGLNTTTYNAWAQSQLDYILGSSGHSFVVGFGVNPPLRPYHRAASCNNPPATCTFRDLSKVMPNPHVLFGAVVSGPDKLDNWIDIRTEYQQTNVALDFNSCYSGLLAAMIEIH